MNVTPIVESEFASTVMAVPPLARHADLTLNVAENRKLIQHMEAGGVRTLLYGGNANLYHVAPSEYRELLDMLAENTAPTTRVIPAIGPDFGKMQDQARVLAQTSYRTAMVLPLAGFTTSAGVETGLKRIVDLAGIPLTLYIKSEEYVDVDTLARLVDGGTLIAVKYAIVRGNPADDAYLRRLLQSVSPSKVISGMGERPALVHVRDFGMAAWTTGSGCIATNAVMALLKAAKEGRADDAQRLYDRFMPLETLRDNISLIRVLHDAVTFTGIADMGPHLPLLSESPAASHAEIADAARGLLAFDRSLGQGA
ncbi:dihydrodipicolinate synthase family protein [Paraburkholderia caballeronis]|uniref:Dihydrodipicolinate synthase/N-acetylneuraminate lyase n=1 Tax=Paraburkholderia caballeronis TaxID=416943 RepID=A0A1H7FV68_9BURK|nr:dihydrodipicolinate synthase family protein [Paraburkholderia caballeronis]PXW24874.1 dihydrodipicolinate synthase/N-acetylneuraminate lyase [Paraburkholderia caballeronis]PXX00604.1 dihydrodipicolinate synthase/N-acetylneuraminate lyase [Paraburkholderia caballeronis]RAJ98667.1 dihydrodipicolinate synthase/N-acetylneuraminate lyase [Paraburkholderia caballeronis]TDV16512.1 dihydrodipicolinate synthase/N-acetylneuraminate lyase [Paraburkholderia caballeronis]TDV18908.1 dihydrodipicolinate s